MHLVIRPLGDWFKAGVLTTHPGPLIAAAFALNLTWRGLFYLLSPFTVIVALASHVYLPSNMPKVDFWETVRRIDFLGLGTGSLFIVLVLIAISQGGHPGTPWNSPLVIAMLTVGGLLGITFLFVEWRATLPMMPLDMFRRPSVAAMLAQSFLFGASYFGYLYYLPLYFQNVKGLSPLMSAVVFLSLVVPQSISSVLAGLYMSKFNRYIEVVYWGFGIWTVGSGLMIMCDEDTHLGLVALFLVLTGSGTGSIFQPTLVALQAHCPKEQRAVVTSNRNTMRSLGAAVSLAVSGALLANTLKNSLPEDLQYLARDSFAAPDLSLLDSVQREQISRAYAAASRAVFIWCFVLIAVSLALTMIIRDSGLSRQSEDVPEQQEGETDEICLEERNGHCKS
jgi:predicted MFS family arabinose efflux permease